MDEKRMDELAVSFANDYVRWITKYKDPKRTKIRALLTILTLFSEMLAIQSKKGIDSPEIDARRVFSDILIPAIKAGESIREETDLLCAKVFAELTEMVVPDILEFFKDELLAAETRNPQRFNPGAKTTGQ